MAYTHKVQCDSKQLVLVDSFDLEIDGQQVPVQVYVLATKKNVKQYCKDTGLPYRDGLTALYSK